MDVNATDILSCLDNFPHLDNVEKNWLVEFWSKLLGAVCSTFQHEIPDGDNSRLTPAQCSEIRLHNIATNGGGDHTCLDSKLLYNGATF